MRYEDHLIDQIQNANDIVDIISQYLPLKRAGRNMKANCPFHEEKTPSFMVNPDKQIFHCFGCSAGGNVFSFLMRYENLSFPEAVRSLAERAHIELPKQSAKRGEGPSLQEQLYDVYKVASDYYHAYFMHPERGKVARDYFLKRGFDLELAKEMKMGWAPEGWHGLFDALSKRGFSNELLLKSALVNRSSKGNLYDTFRGRLLFPIFNLSGKVVAFGGRAMKDEEGPKYLNSPENPVFKKRRELFGLNLAKRHIDRDRRQILISEGYFDFLRLYQHDFKASVATLGTSLTEEHVQVLKRFADEAIVVYDGDKAGEAASLRGLEVFLEGGMNVKVIRLPEGFDPDDFLEKNGKENFEALLGEAHDFFDYKLEILLRRYDQKDSLGLMRITNEFLETFLKIKNPILLDRYLRRLSASLGVDENSLKSELKKLQAKFGTRQKKEEAPSTPSRPAKDSDSHVDVILLALMIDNQTIFNEAIGVLEVADFQSGWPQEVYRILAGAHESGQELKLSNLLNRIDDEKAKQSLVSTLSLQWSPDDQQKAFQDCLQTLGKKKTQRRLEELRRQIARAEKAGSVSEVETIMREYQALLKQQTPS